MHEMGVTRDIVDAVLDFAGKAGATEVRSVYLTIGWARDIVESLLIGAFDYMAKGTVAEHADLVITRVPFTVCCKECGLVCPIDVRDETTWPCPACGKRDYRLNSGMEFSIDKIEIAVPEPA